MATNPNQPMIDFLNEQYRHYTALAAAAKRMLLELQRKECYNEKVQDILPDVKTTSYTGVVEHQ